jgi:hypothetical protein
LKFPYVIYDLAPSPRPVIPVRVEIDGQSLRYDVLVDSGADMNVFDVGIAHALDIDPETGERASFYGVTGVVQDFFIHKVVLQVGKHRISTTAGFAELPGRAYGVVGQRGFFDQFKVTFNLREEELELIGYPKAR